jgi:hypothetical protein
MSLLSELRKSRTDSAQVAYQEFALHTRLGKEGLFCFFEGKGGTDNPYYIPRIKQFISKYYPIKCGGRDTVLKVYELIAIHPEYNKYKKAFFIDKDFNEPLVEHDPPIFETEGYSIENFYVSKEVFAEILKSAIQVSEISESYESCLNTFLDRQNEFHDATLLFNSWYACLIDIRNTEQKPTGVKLDKKLPVDFVSISLEKIDNNYDITKIKETFPDALEVSTDKLDEKIAEFSICEQHKTFRGKFEMQFILTFIELLILDSMNEKKFVKDRISFPFGSKISNDQAISIFSIYAETPDSLISYLRQVTN